MSGFPFSCIRGKSCILNLQSSDDALSLSCLEMLADIRPNEEHARNFVVANPMSSAVQVGPEMSEHEAKYS